MHYGVPVQPTLRRGPSSIRAVPVIRVPAALTRADKADGVSLKTWSWNLRMWSVSGYDWTCRCINFFSVKQTSSAVHMVILES